MRVTVERGGGIAGFVTTTAIRSDALPPAAERELSEQVTAAGLLTMPEPSAPPARQPDQLLYAIGVEAEGRARTLRFSDANLPEDVRRLIAWIDARPETEEKIEPPGGAPPGGAG
jgi:hypothetical protein